MVKMTGHEWNRFYKDQTQHSPSLEAHFNHWRKRQNITSIVVEVANEKAEAVRSAIEAAGGKVVA